MSSINDPGEDVKVQRPVIPRAQGMHTHIRQEIKHCGAPVYQSPETKFATHSSAGVMVITFVFWRVKYDVWASAFQMSLHWSQSAISLGKGNHFLFCISNRRWRKLQQRREMGWWALRWLLRDGKQRKGQCGRKGKQSSLSSVVSVSGSCDASRRQTRTQKGAEQRPHLHFFEHVRHLHNHCWGKRLKAGLLFSDHSNQWFFQFSCSYLLLKVIKLT